MTTSQTDPMIGRLIDGRYQVRSRIARGGMATVYLATDLRLERRVAIKVMHGHLSDDTTFKNRFVQEARSAARLAHPNVVSVFDQGQDSDMAYLVMEYLPGITLRDLLKERVTLTPQQTVDIMHAVLSGLAAAHKAGIVHRDLKPENVLLADDGRIKLGDFGLARAASANTATGQALLGTIAYLSPELVTRGIADTRSDIYALGIMLYEMLVGEQPFVGEQPMQIAYQHANDSVPYPSAKNPSVPTSLDELVLWATERDPDMRPRDARVMLDQLLEAERTIDAVAPDTDRDARDARNETVVMAPATAATTRFAAADTTVVAPAAGAISAPAFGEAAAEPLLEESASLTEVKDRSRRRRRRGVVVLILLLVIAAVVGGVAYWFGDGPGRIIPVPEIAGQSAEAATNALEEIGLEVDPQQQNDLTVAAGIVMSSDPSSGAELHRGDIVTIFVSAGPRSLPVPDLAGLSEEDANAAVTDGGFTLGQTVKRFDGDVDAGIVISATDGAGAALPAEYTEQQPIILTVSLGAIPDVTGQTIDEATTTLENVGLVLEATEPVFSDDVANGDIISQSNPADPVSTGATITVTASKGPEPVSVPDVVGMSRDDAKAALEALTLKVSYSALVDALDNVNTKVTSSNPTAGTQVAKGSTITLSFTLTIP